MQKEELKPIKSLIKESFLFLKTNWKRLYKFTLPVQILVLALALGQEWLQWVSIPNTALFYSALGFTLLLTIIIFLLKFSLFSAGIVVKDIENGEGHASNRYWYKAIVKSTFPVLWIVFLSGLISLLAATILIIVSLIIFVSPSLITVFLFKFGFTNLGYSLFDFLANNNVSIVLLGILALGSIISSLMIAAYSSFCISFYIFEGRKGIDAIASSYVLVRQKYWPIFWRVALVFFVGVLPFLIILFPLKVTIFTQGLKAALVEALFFQTWSGFPVVPMNTSMKMISLEVLSSLFAIPLFTAFNYFLWKDVKEKSESFNEAEYSKTRKWLKRVVGAGLVCLAAIIVAFVYVWFFLQ